ncbi:bifunctional proline dehydrogenase/L-glutamate gamma-semialdehyde dehydrogenase PutA, partial [Neisseria gonorrhoeae]
HKLPFNAEEKKAAAAALGHARIRTLRRAESVLTGPTGERNSISWHAPKRVWIHGGSTVQAFAALTGLAASGVQAVVEPDSPLASYTADLDGLLQISGKPENTGVNHVAALSPLDSSRKQELANRDGALIRILPSGQGLDILQVFEEISCSVNTTAAGGNAGLMAVAD